MNTLTATGIDATHYVLSDDEAAQIDELSQRAQATYVDPHNDHTITMLAALAGDLPLGVRVFLHQTRLPENGVAVLSSLAVDEDASPTPDSWHTADTDASRKYAFTALLLGSLLGDPIGWSAQQAGRVVTDVLPSKGMEQTDVSASSARELSWHTEDGFSPYRADWIGLLCLRNPGGVATTVAGLDTSAVPPEIDQVLREARFVFAMDPAHELAKEPTEAVALLSGTGSTPMLRADRDYMRAVSGDREAAFAMAWLVDHLDSRLSDIVLRGGQMALLNNNVVVHGRRAFDATYSPTERWLKRINVVRDIRRTLPARSGLNRRVLRSL